MAPRLLALVVLIAACAPAISTASSPPKFTDSPAATMSPVATESPVAVPSPIPTETPAPSGLTPADYPPEIHASVSTASFPITTGIRLKDAAVDEAVVNAARWGVERYLNSIDQYRNGQSPVLPITGHFLSAVSMALKESATPGVTRKFEIESLRVDRQLQKPWGTRAYVDVTVTLVDRAVDGNAPDQHETGKLRLTGDKLFVTDGWDYTHGRWFNGFGPLPVDQVRTGVAEAVSHYLGAESWLPRTPAVSWAAEGSPFQRARAKRMLTIDRTQVTSQTFDGVRATIEGFETIDGIWSGIATVRVEATAVTTSAGGNTSLTKLDRHVRVFVLGNWIPEVVDEQLSLRDWASGGDLALGEIDVNRA